jgi:NACHT domain
MPLPGGPSDKAGNSYERRWTVFALLNLLGGEAQTLRIEVPGDDGVGSEFRLMVDGVAVWHQAKRQRAGGPWTVNALVTEGVLPPWQSNLGRGERCVFVASTGAELRELADRARSAQSWDEFATEFLAARDQRARFERLQRAWKHLPEEVVYAALQRVTVHSIGETELADWINDRLRALVTGAEPVTVASVLAQLVDDSVHHELSAADVWTHLATHGVAPRDLDRDAAVVRHVADSADAYLARLRPLYIGGHELDRPEADTAARHLDDGRRTILAGAAGAGKSVVAAQVVTMARRRHQPVLVVSADRLPDAATTTQLGAELGLPESPVTVLAAVAAGGDALLVIDQLDAVSVTSGRHPERLGLISDLLREARSYPKLRLLLACRHFDIENDRALRAAAHDNDAAVVAIGDLDEEQIRRVLADAGLATTVPAPLMRLLAVPLHLALYVELALAGVSDLGSARTLTQLYDRYWDVKRGACRRARGGTDKWLQVIERLVGRMNDRQALSVPEPVVDDLDQQVRSWPPKAS